MNPNNCDTCGHKKNPDGGWCYMFQHEPQEQCMQHTYHQEISVIDVKQLMQRILREAK